MGDHVCTPITDRKGGADEGINSNIGGIAGGAIVAIIAVLAFVVIAVVVVLVVR